MQNDQKAPAKRRIDLSNCKLLSAYGRNAVDSNCMPTKVGTLTKPGILNKFGILTKSGLMTKPA
jgi:hypothetical protein